MKLYHLFKSGVKFSHKNIVEALVIDVVPFIRGSTIDSSDGQIQKQINLDYIAAIKKGPNFILDTSTNAQVLKHIESTFSSTMDDIYSYKFNRK